MARRKRAQALSEDARRAMEAGEFRRAVQNLEEVKLEYPGTPSARTAHLTLAEYYLTAGEDLDKAHLELTPFLATSGTENGGVDEGFRTSPERPWAEVLSGRIELARGHGTERLETARGAFSRVAAAYAGSPAVAAARYFIGETHRLERSFDAAAAAYREASAGHPASEWAARALLGEARCRTALGQWTVAADLLQRARSRHSHRPEAEIAKAWSTLLYRLYARPMDPYRYTGRVIPGPARKLKGVGLLGVSPDGASVIAGTRDTRLAFEIQSGRQVGPPDVPVVALIARPDGELLSVRATGMLRRNSVVEFSVPGNEGTAAPLREIRAAVLTSLNQVIVSDRKRASLDRFDLNGRFLDTWSKASAVRLAVDPEDRVASLADGARDIMVLASDGKVTGRVPASGGGLRKPIDIAFDGLGHLYILDRDAAAVLVFAPQDFSKPLARVATAAKSPGAFRKAKAIALDAMGRLFIYDESVEGVLVYQ